MRATIILRWFKCDSLHKMLHKAITRSYSWAAQIPNSDSRARILRRINVIKYYWWIYRMYSWSGWLIYTIICTTMVVKVKWFFSDLIHFLKCLLNICQSHFLQMKIKLIHNKNCYHYPDSHYDDLCPIFIIVIFLSLALSQLIFVFIFSSLSDIWWFNSNSKWRRILSFVYFSIVSSSRTHLICSLVSNLRNVVAMFTFVLAEQF